MNPLIRRVSVDGKDIKRIVFDKLSPACQGEPLEHAVLAMLTLSVLMMRPNVDLEKLQSVVMSASEHIIMGLMDTPTGAEAN